MAGIAPYHIRILCDNPWDGGGGYTPKEVGDMTLDQIFMRMADRKKLRKKDDVVRSVAMAPMNATKLVDDQGLIRGRAEDGTPIRGRIGGLSATQEAYAAMEKSGGD